MKPGREREWTNHRHGKVDQLDAGLRDLLERQNDLEALAAQGLDPGWLATASANDLVGALLDTAVKASRDGAVFLFAGIEL